MDTLKSYFENKFDTLEYTIVTDYSNTINIWIFTENSEYGYIGRYPCSVKQPWFGYNNIVLNLKINQALINLLPKDFLLLDTISDEALINDYIVWYFERRKIIY